MLINIDATFINLQNILVKSSFPFQDKKDSCMSSNRKDLFGYLISKYSSSFNMILARLKTELINDDIFHNLMNSGEISC